MNRMLKYLAGAAVTAAVAGTATMSYAAPATAPHGAITKAGAAHSEAASTWQPHASTATKPKAKKTAPTPRIVAPGERMTAVPGFQLWLTAEGKHWTTPSAPEPQFRSVVDGNIDRNTPGVSMRAEITEDRAYLSGLYYGGKGTASSVEVETAAGTVRGKLIELAGRPGWGVWYATADIESDSNSWHFVTRITVHDSEEPRPCRSTRDPQAPPGATTSPSTPVRPGPVCCAPPSCSPGTSTKSRISCRPPWGNLS